MLTTAFRADPLRAAGGFGLAALGSVANIITALWVKLLVQAAIAEDQHRVGVMAVLIAVSGVVSIASSLTRLDLRFRLEEVTSLYVDRRIIELTTSIAGLEHHERPRYLDELELLRSQKGMLSQSVASLIENFSMLAGLLTTGALLASLHPLLLLLPLCGVPSLVSAAVTERRMNAVRDRTAERRRRSTAYFELATTAEPGKELRVFGLGDELRDRHDAIWDDIDGELTRAQLGSALLTTLGWLVFVAGYVGAIAFVAYRAVHHQATVADVVLALSLAGRVNGQVSSAFFMATWLVRTLKVVGRYLWLVDYERVTRWRATEPADAPDVLTEGIDLHDVSFRYPGTDHDVLTDVNLFIPAGTTVAVVGDNGAGKTTLVKLLSRFYEPTAGSITVDGVDLGRIDPAAWRARLAAGFQDFARLELIVRETVGVGDLAGIGDVETVERALSRASASDVPLGLAAGLDTQVGKSFEGGVELSGGQWQKLALARAMMREKPLVLLLDEPTAALDAETEHALFERYAGAARATAHATGAITLLVSHRFSTVRMADLILVIDQGHLAEAGSHDQLVAAGGLYAELYELQASAYR
jgi:ATP-binding cassette subfamily B protein